MKYQEIEGNLITMALAGSFDVIAHGCNCFCTMKSGIAPQMARAFGCDKFFYENDQYSGDIRKLGNIDYEHRVFLPDGRVVSYSGHTPEQVHHDRKDMHTKFELAVVNCYTQYGFNTHAPAVNYDAISLCFTKMNHVFKGKYIGLPQIGCGLAGGDWDLVSFYIRRKLKDCDVTVVIYDNT